MPSHKDRTKLKPETLQYYRHLARRNIGEEGAWRRHYLWT